MSWYAFLLFVHVAMAVTWVGGGLAAQLFALRASASGDPGRLATFLRDVEWIGTRVFVPASLFAFVSGVLLVIDSDFYGFGDDWIVIGLVLYATTFLVGALYFGPEAGRVAKLQAEGAPEAEARTLRLVFLTRLDLVLLWLIVYAMTVKPDFSDASTIVWGIAGGVVAGALVYWRHQSSLRPAAAPGGPAG